ncbi:MAG: ABC transporter permease [Ruminiclostridium sp.]
MYNNKGLTNKIESFKCSILNIMNKDKNMTRLFFMLIVVFTVMSVIGSKFFSVDNFTSMAFQFPEYGILAICIMVTMLTGGIDLSVVGILNLSSILAAMTMSKLIPKDAPADVVFCYVLLAVGVSLVVGILLGFFNGFVIAKIGIPPILATLATMQIYTGIGIVITQGKAVVGIPELFSSIINNSLVNIPIPLVMFALCVTGVFVILNKTSFGIKMQMLGTNSTASTYAGINNAVVLFKTYALSGFLAAISGLIIVARTNSAKADYAASYTLLAILIAVMGGVNPNGGYGKIGGIVLAVLTLQFLSSGFNALQLNNFVKEFAWGLVLILIMVINFYTNNRKKKISNTEKSILHKNQNVS